MNRSFKWTLGLLLILVGLVFPSAVPASGTYCVCITKPPTGKDTVDRDKYDAGQKIFNGRTKLSPLALPAEKAAANEAVLTELQALLPKRQAKKTDLSQWAGQLSEEQLDALAYYLQRRYGK